MTGQTPDLRDSFTRWPIPSPRALGTVPPAAPSDPMVRPAAIDGIVGTGPG